MQGDRTEQRFVRSEDPSLTPEANRLLTLELRDVIGTETVTVPAGTPARHTRPHGTRGPFTANLVANRQLLLVTLATAIVFGAFLSLVSGSWWALVAAVTIHALGTTAVTGGVIQLATLTEHVSPAVAARLEAEGVADPDRVLTRLVAAMEQRTAMTPASGPGRAAGSRMADIVPPAVTAFLAAFTIAVAAWFGGTMWVLPAVILPLCGFWILLMSRIDAHGEGGAYATHVGRTPALRRILPAGATIVLGVAIFMIGMGFLVHAL
ncbi:MAG TPA: hypothetical protein VFT42_02240 [Solirubrobacteraceae bacterium]|nr:hypothetical protein [Solirubrobacteraceae bacterium]